MARENFWQRLVAWLVDQVIISIGYALASIILGIIFGLRDGDNLNSQNPIFVLSIGLTFLILLIGQFLYFGYFWSARGRSVGMGLTNVRVVKNNGSSLSFIMAGLRGTLGYYLSGLIFGLGYLWCFVNGQGETWHDKIFGTEVLKG